MVTTVLIVEDEPEIREMLKFSLTRAGFRSKKLEPVKWPCSTLTPICRTSLLLTGCFLG